MEELRRTRSCRRPETVLGGQRIVYALVSQSVSAHHVAYFAALETGLLVEPVLHPGQVPLLLFEHSVERGGDDRVHARIAQVEREVAIHATLEDLREGEHLHHGDRSADNSDVPILVSIPNRRRLAADRDDSFGPQKRVCYLLRAVPGKLHDQLGVAGTPNHLAEYEAAMQLGRAIEIQE